MNKVVIAAVVVLVATLGLSGYALTVYVQSPTSTTSRSTNTSTGLTSTSALGSPGTGTMNIYLTDSPHSNATLKYLLVNVTSVTLKYDADTAITNSTASTTLSTSSTLGTSGNSTVSTTSTTNSSTTSTSTASSSTSSSSTNATTTSTIVTSSVTTSSNSTVSSTTTCQAAQTTGENRFVFQVQASVGTNVNLTSLSGNSLLLGAAKVPAGNVTGIILSIDGAKAFWTGGGSTQLKVVANGKLMIPVHFTVQCNGTTNLTLDIVPGDIHTSQGQASVLTPVIHVVVSSSPGGTVVTTETSETETETQTTTSTSTS